jgi:hypothetical protein
VKECLVSTEKQRASLGIWDERFAEYVQDKEEDVTKSEDLSYIYSVFLDE